MVKVFCGVILSLLLAVSAPSAAMAASAPTYGQTVDGVDSVPPAPGTAPPSGALPHRPETSLAFSGDYSAPFPGSLGGDYLMFFQGQHVTVVGEGYFVVRWEVAWFNIPGELVPPRWTGLTGSIFHVASAGWHRMDDHSPTATDPTQTWMGPSSARDTLPAGTQQMWQNEYYYVNGAVTLWDDESSVDYNLSVTPITASAVQTDVDSSGSPSSGFVRYGVVRDTGTNSAPVPQYATRQNLTAYAQLAAVPQQSQLEVAPVEPPATPAPKPIHKPTVISAPRPTAKPSRATVQTLASITPSPEATPRPDGASQEASAPEGSLKSRESSFTTTPAMSVLVNAAIIAIIAGTLLYGTLQRRRIRKTSRLR